MLHPAYTIDPSAPEDPDAADRLYERERDAERRAGWESLARPQPSAEHRDPGPAGGPHHHAALTTRGSPPAAGRSSAALPDDFATLADRRYLGRVARVIPPRTRPFNWQVEGL